MLAHINKALLFGSGHQTWSAELIGDNLLMVWKRDRGRTEGRWRKHLPGFVRGAAGSRRKQGWMNNGTDWWAERLPPAKISGFCSWSPQIFRTLVELLPAFIIWVWGYFLQWLAASLLLNYVFQLLLKYRQVWGEEICPYFLSGCEAPPKDIFLRPNSELHHISQVCCALLMT